MTDNSNSNKISVSVLCSTKWKYFAFVQIFVEQTEYLMNKSKIVEQICSKCEQIMFYLLNKLRCTSLIC